MKLVFNLFALVAVMMAPAVWAQTAPVTLTFQSYRAFTDGFTKVVDAVSPGSASDALDEMREGLGIQELKGIDQTRPWQVAVWADSISAPPCVSIRVPVSDFNAFRDGLDEGVLKGEEDANKIQKVGNYATIWLEFGQPSSATTAGEKAWKPEQVGAAGGIVQLVVQPGSGLREELVGALGMGRMAFGAAMSGQDMQAMGGMDPKVMGELIGVYFDMIETGLKGFQSLAIKLDLQGDTLVMEETVVPVAGSTLANWFQIKDGSLGSLSSYLSPESPMGLAMRFEENDSLMPTLNRIISLSMQMQGMPADSDAIKDTARLIESLVPLQFAGSFDINEGVQFAGVYQFPGKDTAKVYADMKEFLRNSMQNQVGEDKPYSSVTITEGERKVDGVSVDRATMVANLDAPIYQMPGQREMIESLWPGGKIIFDYAMKGKDLYMGTPGKLDALLAGPSTAAAYKPAGVNPRTAAFGFLNLFKLMESIMAANPMMSDEDKEKLSNIDSAGTAMDFRVDLGDNLFYKANIPLKFFKSIGQLADH